MSTAESFGDWLQREMQQRGWNQAELARRSRLTTAQISRIMTGEQQPGTQASQKIARAFYLPIETVYRHAGLLPPTEPQPEGVEELIYHFVHLGEEDRKRLLVIARSLHEASEKK